MSHSHHLLGVDRVLVSPDKECEACVNVKVVGSDEYRVVLRPSGAFDALPIAYPKRLLVGVLFGMLVAVVVTHRMAKKVDLNAKWYQ